MLKLIFSIIVIVLLYTLYSNGLKPYFNALSETHHLLAKADIPLDKSTDPEYKDSAIQELTQKCSYGVVKVSENAVRCASNATIIMFK